jgi:Secretion system C-terminal sorting domain
MFHQVKILNQSLIVFAIFAISVVTSQAQIKVTFPVERTIFQRNNSDEATITFGGYYTQAIDKVEARLIRVLSGQGQDTDWTVVQTNPKGGTYFGSIKGRGGWYSLEVRGSLKGVIVSRDALSRVGIGEVFVIAGDANAEGVPNGGGLAATDERVNTATYNNRTQSSIADPSGLTFSAMTAEGSIAPRGQSAWAWGALGDLLVKKLNVPVMFFNVGWAGVSMKQWVESAAGKVVKDAAGQTLPTGQPYNNMRMVIKYYCSVLGFRAILWQHGGVDNLLGTSKSDYANNLQALLDLSRNDHTGFVPWVISRTSRVGNTISQNVIDGQNQVLGYQFDKVYEGPNTDVIQPSGRINGGIQIPATGIVELAKAWDDVFPPKYFANTIPILPRPSQPLTLSCNGANTSVTLTAPAGFRTYLWTTGETTQSIIVYGAGTYQAILKEPDYTATVFTAPIVLTESVQPPAPTILPAGTQYVCTDSSLVLNINTSESNVVTWSEGTVGKSIKVSKPASFTAKQTNILGCTSPNSSAVVVKNLTVAPPTITNLGRYTLQAIPDPEIYKLGETKVSSIVWDWRINSLGISPTSDIIKGAQDGNYTVRSKVTFDALTGGGRRVCSSVFSKIFPYQVGLDEGLVIYPNPSNKGYISIETLRDINNVELSVYDFAGRVVFYQKFATLSERKVIDLTELNEGEYLIRLSSPTFNQTRRVVIDY